MPRRPRELVEGAVYHVYNRLAHGAEIFSRRKVAERFIAAIERARDRDDLTILAWCVMSSHFHLAVRTGPVPLSRTIGFVQARFGQDHNRRSGESGPLWAARFKAKLVDDERYLTRLIAYIHLNPVAAGIVSDPARYPLSGHAELIGTQTQRLVDVDGTLALFDSGRAAARRVYLRLLKGERSAAWAGDEPGHLPWWKREHDGAIVAPPAGPRLDPLGRSVGHERARLSPAEFVERACEALRADPGLMTSTARHGNAVAVRHLVGGLAVERWRIRAGELAAYVGCRPEVVSRWAARAGVRRLHSKEFRAMYEELDATLASERTRRG